MVIGTKNKYKNRKRKEKNKGIERKKQVKKEGKETKGKFLLVFVK